MWSWPRVYRFSLSSIPDDALITLAGQGKLHEACRARGAGARMLADPRSDQFVVNFAGQWLNLRACRIRTPPRRCTPDFDDNLRLAMRKRDRIVRRQHRP
jgi:hypothetical protein